MDLIKDENDTVVILSHEFVQLLELLIRWDASLRNTRFETKIVGSSFN